MSNSKSFVSCLRNLRTMAHFEHLKIKDGHKNKKRLRHNKALYEYVREALPHFRAGSAYDFFKNVHRLQHYKYFFLFIWNVTILLICFTHICNKNVRAWLSPLPSPPPLLFPFPPATNPKNLGLIRVGNRNLPIVDFWELTVVIAAGLC